MPGECVVSGRQRPEDAAEGLLGRQPAPARRREHGGHRDRRGTVPARLGFRQRHLVQQRLQPLGRQIEAGEAVPFGPRRHRHAALECGHLLRVHQPGVIVLVAGEGQAIALDRVSDEAGRLIVGDAVKGVEHRAHVVPGEVGHQPPQGLIVMLVEDGADAGVAVEVAAQMLAPPLAALVDQRRIERVRAGVDPFAQLFTVRAGEGGLQQPAVFERDDAPAEHLEQRVDAAEQAVGDDGV